MSRPAALRFLDRAALALVIAFALGLLALFVRSAILYDEGSNILPDVLGIIWLSLPIAVAAALVGASPGGEGATLFLTLEILLILLVVAFLLPGLGRGSALALMFLPFLQYAAIILVFVIALAFGWRMRPDFLKN
jgi:hypothetical protein